MSLISSQVSADSVSDLKERECEPSNFARLIHTANASLPSIGRTFPVMATSAPSNPLQQTLFAEGSPASLSALPVPGSDTAKRMTTTSGLKCCALFANVGLLGSLVKMLLESNQWHSDKWYLTWRGADTKSRRRLKFRLVPSDTIIGGRASGFLHTPTRAANMAAPSMQKHKCCRGLEMNPEEWERRMGFPPDWTDLEPLGTPSCPKSQKSSGEPS